MEIDVNDIDHLITKASGPYATEERKALARKLLRSKKESYVKQSFLTTAFAFNRLRNLSLTQLEDQVWAVVESVDELHNNTLANGTATFEWHPWKHGWLQWLNLLSSLGTSYQPEGMDSYSIRSAIKHNNLGPTLAAWMESARKVAAHKEGSSVARKTTHTFHRAKDDYTLTLTEDGFNLYAAYKRRKTETVLLSLMQGYGVVNTRLEWSTNSPQPLAHFGLEHHIYYARKLSDAHRGDTGQHYPLFNLNSAA